jgi:hypothetical protein
MFIEDIILQPILTNPNDLIIDEPIQITKLEPLPFENVNSKLVEFELVNNYLTHGNIFGTYVLVHNNNKKETYKHLYLISL